MLSAEEALKKKKDNAEELVNKNLAILEEHIVDVAEDETFVEVPLKLLNSKLGSLSKTIEKLKELKYRVFENEDNLVLQWGKLAEKKKQSQVDEMMKLLKDEKTIESEDEDSEDEDVDDDDDNDD